MGFSWRGEPPAAGLPRRSRSEPPETPAWRVWGCGDQGGRLRFPSFILLAEPVWVVARVPAGPHSGTRLRLAEGGRERSRDAVCSWGLRRATPLITWREMLIA